MKTPIAALGAALCAGCAALPASAGIALGAFASTTDAVTQQYAEDSAPGAGPGSYRASVAGASADLSWGAADCTFTGEATGGNGITARSRGVAILVFGDDTLFTISWSMAQCVGSANDVGWGLVDVATEKPVAALSFEGVQPAAFGGVGTGANGSFGATVAAGTYLLVMSAEIEADGGQFAYAASFAPVPAPGGFALLVAAALVGRRRRR
jgi:MYXO-CTERM domain-containing protein